MRDHPRIRGEHAKAMWSLRNAGGSSPHTRGALTLWDKQMQEYGIIPAYAGSTLFFHCASKPPSDHPRIRGEHPVLSLCV